MGYINSTIDETSSSTRWGPEDQRDHMAHKGVQGAKGDTGPGGRQGPKGYTGAQGHKGEARSHGVLP